MNNDISKELIKQRIKQMYEDYLIEYSQRFKNEDYLLSRYALKVLVDIYTDDGMDDNNRLIHQDWDIIESAIINILESDDD